MGRVDKMLDPQAQLEEFQRWYDAKKLKHYQDTHEESIEWGKKLIAPPQLRGAWLEVKYIPYHGTEFDYQKVEDVSREIIDELSKRLLDIFWLLWKDVKWCCPFVIQINDNGNCHLLHCGQEDGRTKSLDMILREGELKITKRKV